MFALVGDPYRGLISVYPAEIFEKLRRILESFLDARNRLEHSLDPNSRAHVEKSKLNFFSSN